MIFLWFQCQALKNSCVGAFTKYDIVRKYSSFPKLLTFFYQKLCQQIKFSFHSVEEQKSPGWSILTGYHKTKTLLSSWRQVFLDPNSAHLEQHSTGHSTLVSSCWNQMKLLNGLYMNLRQYIINQLNLSILQILYWEKVYKIWKLP